MKRDGSKQRNRHLGAKESYIQPLLTRHIERRALSIKASAECALMLVLSEGRASGGELSITRIGTNVVLSWPSSASNLVLQASTELATNWTAETAPVVDTGGNLSVTVPINGARQFYRLKDVINEKDPLEKDPSIDKNVEKPGDKDTEKDSNADKDANLDKTTEGKDPNADKDPTEIGKEAETGGFNP